MPSSTGAVGIVDLSECKDTRSLANAIQDAMRETGFIFLINHGLESAAEELFQISRKSRPNSVYIPLIERCATFEEAFFATESEAEKQRCAYAGNRGYTRVSQEV